MKRWQKKAILLMVGVICAFFVYKINTSRMIDAYYHGTEQGSYNFQRVLQLDSLISLNDSDYTNDVALWEDIDVHGQLFYIVLSEIGARCGLDAMSMLIVVQLICISLLVIFYPLIIFLLTDNVWVGLISLLLLYGVNRVHFFSVFTDTYYAQPWSILFAFPLLVLIASKRKWDFATLAACLVCIGIMVVANIVRSFSGITILMLLLIIFIYYFLAVRGRAQKLFSIGMVVLTLFNCFGVEGMLVSVISYFHPMIPTVMPASPWHAIWCGLGYYANDYGFAWNDWAAYARAAAVCPGVVNYSEPYYEILKADCLGVLKTDPGFIVRTYLQKFYCSIKYIFCENLGMGIPLLLAIILLLVILAIHKRVKGYLGLRSQYYNIVALWWTLLGLTGIFGGVLQGVIGEPNNYNYLLGGYASVGCLILGILFYGILQICDLLSQKKIEQH